MLIWRIDRRDFPPLVMAHRQGEPMQRAAMRVRKLLGIDGRGHAMYSDHSTVFYIRDYGRSIVVRREEAEEPGGEVWRAFLAAELGTHRWCVAPRMTTRLARDYDRAVSQHAFNDLKALFLTKMEIQNDQSVRG